jgi:hypothetical protein
MSTKSDWAERPITGPGIEGGPEETQPPGLSHAAFAAALKEADRLAALASQVKLHNVSYSGDSEVE